jgi:hypothetical protein
MSLMMWERHAASVRIVLVVVLVVEIVGREESVASIPVASALPQSRKDVEMLRFAQHDMA